MSTPVPQPFGFLRVANVEHTLVLAEDEHTVELLRTESEALVLLFEHNGVVRSEFGKIGNVNFEGDGWTFYSNPLRTRYRLNAQNSFEAYQKVAIQYLQSLHTKPVQTAELLQKGGAI